MTNIFYPAVMVLMLCCAGSVQAQSDERFYLPDKEWIGLDRYDYEDIILTEGADTTRSIIIAPFDSVQSCGTIVFFHGNAGNISKWVGYVKPFLYSGFQVAIMNYRD